MKLLQILSLVGLCLLFTPARPAAFDTTLQNENGAGVRGRLRWGRPATGRERNPNPRNLLPWQLLREREQARGERLVSHPPSMLVPGVDPPIAHPVFQITPTYPSGGGNATAIAVGDFNGDGKPDLAVSNECFDPDCKAGSVGVLLGKGDGTYQPVVRYKAGALFTQSVAIGDFNGDGKLDLAVSNLCTDVNCTGSGSVSVFLGNGDGSFQPAVSFATRSGGQLVTGDLNGDGKLDLVMVNGLAIGVLLGNGDGTFGAELDSQSGGRGPVAVALGDFNGDGRLDLAVGNIDSNDVSILLGNGDGSFQSAVTYASGGIEPSAVVVGDFNGDGNPDLAVLNAFSKSDTSTGSVRVFAGKGDGTFTLTTGFRLQGGPGIDLAAGDFNGDGKLDLVATVCGDDCGASVLLGNGNGTFQTARIFDAESVTAAFAAVGDFNGDGKADLALASFCACDQASLTVLLGSGNGDFQASREYPTGGLGQTPMALGDFNLDGKPDLAVADQCVDSACTNSSVRVLLGRETGTFQPGAVYATGGFGAMSVPMADFNRDGKPDLVVANRCIESLDCTNGSVGVLLGNGNGTFQAPVSYPAGGVFTSSVAVADLNGDGKPDLVVANQCSNLDQCTPGSVAVLLGNGDGTFQAPVTYSPGNDSAFFVAVGDFNGDSKLDLAVVRSCDFAECPSPGDSVAVLLGNGDGTFQSPVIYSSAGFGAMSVAVGDFNEDGNLDLAVADDFSVGVLLGNGDGTFAAAVSYPTSGGSVGVGDFNGDGKPDLVFSGRDVLLGNGDGTFNAAQNYNPAHILGFSLVVADFNRDGKPDVAVGSSNLITILTNIANPFHYATATAVTSSADPVSLGQMVKFTATVTPAFARATMTGKVTFSDGGHALASVSVSNGRAAFSTSSLNVGTHAITAIYDGDENFLPSTSPVLTEMVDKAATSTTLTSSRNPSVFGQSVTFRAHITGAFGGIPTGTVTFKNRSAILGTVVVTGARATFATTTLKPGRHTIVAVYSGDGNFLSSRSPGLVQTVSRR